MAGDLEPLLRNYLGVDEFLGQVTLPLQDYDVYEKPRTRCSVHQHRQWSVSQAQFDGVEWFLMGQRIACLVTLIYFLQKWAL